MAAQAASLLAVTQGTHQKRSRYFGYYCKFLEWVELPDDPFLTTLLPHERTRLIGAFAHAYRLGRFSTAESPDPRASGTVRDAIDAVAEAYRNNGHPSPIHDRNGNFEKVLSAQLKGYKNCDPSVRPQKALAPSLLKEMCKDKNNPLDLANHQLCRGAFFFAMRSCEYSSVDGPERRTKRLRCCDIQFYRNKKRMSFDDPLLYLADTVVITFRFQKTDERNEVVVMHKSGDSLLCPVRAWSAIIRRIHKLPGCSDQTYVNAYQAENGSIKYVKSSDILYRIRRAGKRIGEARLGYHWNELGTHSIRSGAAMAMYLSGLPAFTIMLIGRWASDAFLKYIRRQVQEFSSGISAKMISTEDFFSVGAAATVQADLTGTTSPHQHFTGRGLNLGLTTQHRAPTINWALSH